MRFLNSKLALEEYDRTELRRRKKWEEALTEAQIEKADLADQVALRKVRRAFYEDTKIFNSKSACDVVGIEFVRKCVEGDR